MPKPKQDEIDEELKKQDDDVYGTGYTDGDPDSFAETKEMVKDVTGNEPDEQEPFSMADEVDDDEKAIRDDEPEDKTEDEIEKIESDIEKIEKEKRDIDTSNDE